MIGVLLNLLWGLVVALSFVALGRILARLIWPEHKNDLSLTAGWGMAAMVILGGLLNLAGLASSASLVALVIALIVVETLISWKTAQWTSKNAANSTAVSASATRERGAAFWIACVVLFAAFKYASSLTVAFNEPDDQRAYMFQCARLLQTGSIGADPFSDRQLLSLNGQIFLLALVCSVCPMKYAFLLDPGICWLLLGGFTWSIVRKDLRGSIQDACLFTGLVYLVGVPFINLSGYLTAGVLYLTLIRTSYLGLREQGDIRGWALVMLAVLIAAFCALKTTYLPYIGLYLLAWFALRAFRTPLFTLARELVLIGIASTVLVLPWMYQQYLSGGTFFYPTLGKGFHISGPGFNVLGDSLAFKAKATIYYLASGHAIPALLGVVVLAFNPFPDDRDRWRVLLAALFAAAAGSVFIAFYTATNALVRYTLEFLFVALIPAGLFGFLGPRLTRGRVALAFCLVGFVGIHWENLHTRAARLVDFVNSPGPGRAYKDSDLARIRQAQASVPPGKQILAWVNRGFLFDFVRNPIWNMDQGLVSPPPGLPLSSDRAVLSGFLTRATPNFPAPCPADEMITYLQGHGIDFVIFQRDGGARAAGLDPDNRPVPSWNRILQVFSRLITEDLTAIESRCDNTYNDGDMFVVQVSSPTRKAVRPPAKIPIDSRARATVTPE